MVFDPRAWGREWERLHGDAGRYQPAPPVSERAPRSSIRPTVTAGRRVVLELERDINGGQQISIVPWVENLLQKAVE